MIRSNRYLFILLILFACNNKHVNTNQAETKTIKHFDDAKQFLDNWSKENTLISHFISDPDNLHPTNGNSNPRVEIFKYTQRTLLYIDFEKQIVTPGLVKSLPEISADGLHYSYELRDNIKWDDGSNLSADDILFTAKAFKCPLTNDPSVRFYWENVDNIIRDSINPLRFTLVMKNCFFQNVTFLTSFSIMENKYHDPENILSAFTLAQFGDTTFDAKSFPKLVSWAAEFNDDKYGRDPQKLNGLGMYKVTDWQAGQYITLEKKKNHWTEGSSDFHEYAYPEKIICKINKDETSQILDFRSQKMDVSTNTSVGMIEKLNSDQSFKDNYNTALMPTYNYTYICFNERPDGVRNKKLFDDVNVRHAVAMLTPVDDLIKLVYKDYSSQCKRVISNVSPLKKEFNSEIEEIHLDVKAAEKLLAKSGWTDSDNDGILDKIIDGKKTDLSADLNYLSSSAEWKSMAEYFTEQLAKAGLKINPVPMDLKLFVEKGKAHDFDLILGSWGGTSMPEDYTQLWHTSSWTNHGSNYPGFGSSESDALIESMKFELNDSARIVLSRKLQKMICDDQPMVFLFSSMRKYIIHKRFGNQMIFSERPGLLENSLRLLSGETP